MMHERSITLRTDYPGGSLPLHLIAACASFDCTPTTTKPDDDHPLNIYPLQCTITNNIRKAYECTAIIRQAYPQAIWEVDCKWAPFLCFFVHHYAQGLNTHFIFTLLGDGEIPLHASATYGNVGSLLALLVGCTDMESVKGASLMADDRGKTPLDRACERLCSMCVHGRKKESRTRNTSFRKSIARDDPFQAIGSTNTNSNEGDRRSLLLRSSQRGSGRTRIPGCGSSFRNSFSSSFLLGESVLGIDEQLLRDSFVSPRRPIDINLGLEELDRDGAEEIAKVDLLARAAHGFFVIGSSETYTYTDNFQLVHSVIALDCPPEIIWHACAIHKDQVGERDAFGRTPLFIACERFVTLYSQLLNSLKVSTEDDTTQDDDSSQTEAEATTSKFVASILLGCNTHLLENTSPIESSESLPSPVESETNNSSNNDLMNKISLSKEVISILLHSPLFGKTEMASVTDAAGRLPLHIILEGGVGWKDDGTEDSNSYNVVQSLIEVYPRALEVKDDTSGLLPFMIAALPKESSSASENQECTKQIETIFQLLCRDPNAVVLGVSRQRQDNYHWV